MMLSAANDVVLRPSMAAGLDAYAPILNGMSSMIAGIGYRKKKRLTISWLRRHSSSWQTG